MIVLSLRLMALGAIWTWFPDSSAVGAAGLMLAACAASDLAGMYYGEIAYLK